MAKRPEAAAPQQPPAPEPQQPPAQVQPKTPAQEALLRYAETIKRYEALAELVVRAAQKRGDAVAINEITDLNSQLERLLGGLSAKLESYQ